MRPLKRWLLTIAAFSVAVPLAGAIYVSATWDPNDALPGSLAYLLGIPGAMKLLPVPEACGTPRYGHTGPDGAKLSFSEVRFETRLSADALADVYRAFARTGRCRLSEDGGVLFAEGCEAASPTENFRLQIGTPEPFQGSACLPVSITSLGNDP
ncbi:MAG: hypothetical protein H7Y08_09585 [Rhizobiaceae bacterium]|nr:hypothetical protein [Rhizobiaceae bacterium]